MQKRTKKKKKRSVWIEKSGGYDGFPTEPNERKNEFRIKSIVQKNLHFLKIISFTIHTTLHNISRHTNDRFPYKMLVYYVIQHQKIHTLTRTHRWPCAN